MIIYEKAPRDLTYGVNSAHAPQLCGMHVQSLFDRLRHFEDIATGIIRIGQATFFGENAASG